jgi:branched-chain amino acid transport system substrate-binding protein
MKKRYAALLLGSLVIVAMLVAACAPAATPAPEEEPMEEPAAEPMEEPTAEPMEEPTAEPMEEPAEEMMMPEECAEEGACAIYAPGEPIRLGFAGPLSGDVSAFGQDVSQAIQTALADFGEFEGHAIEVDIQDDLGTPEGGAQVANKFAADPTIVAVVGHMFSGATNAAMPVYEDVLIPMVSPSATRIDLTQQGYAVFNRVVASDLFQGDLAAGFLYNNLGARKLALIHDGGAYGQGLAERTEEVFIGLGGEVVAFEAITVGETDYSAVLTGISALAPDAIFFGGYTGEGAILVNQRGGVGLGGIPFLSDDGIYGTQFVELAAANAEGSYCTSAAEPEESDAKAVFDAAYEEQWGVAAGELSPYSWHGYDATMVALEAIKKVAIVGDDGTVYIPRAALVEAVRATSGYQGLTGEITCDENGDCKRGGFAVYQVQDGVWVELPEDFAP